MPIADVVDVDSRMRRTPAPDSMSSYLEETIVNVVPKRLLSIDEDY